MPKVKVIDGHTSCQGVRRYLMHGRKGEEKRERALAVDCFGFEEPQATIGAAVDFDWAASMDAERRAAGQDKQRNGKRKTRTYKHIIVSPDPNDPIQMSLGELRQLVADVQRELLGGYQTAAVYHDDSKNGNLHAHIVVNTTPLGGGRKLHWDNPYEVNQLVQELTAEMLVPHAYFENGFAHDVEPKTKATAARAAAAEPGRPFTRQRVYERRDERGMAERGGYSWKADLRRRVMLARNLAVDEASFRKNLTKLGVTVADNSPKAYRRDWVYAFADCPTRKAAGEKMGYAVGKHSVLKRFESIRSDAADAVRPFSDMAREELDSVVESSLKIDGAGELAALARAVDVCERYDVRSMTELERRISYRSQKYGEGNRSVIEMREVKPFLEAHAVLPQRVDRRKGDLEVADPAKLEAHRIRRQQEARETLARISEEQKRRDTERAGRRGGEPHRADDDGRQQQDRERDNERSRG